MRRRARPAGFTLVEVVVALLLLQVGILGVVGLSLAATRISATAVAVEGALGAAESIADSLLVHGYGGPGARETPFGPARWGPVDGAPVGVEVFAASPVPGGESTPLVRLLLDPGAGP